MGHLYCGHGVQLLQQRKLAYIEQGAAVVGASSDYLQLSWMGLQ